MKKTFRRWVGKDEDAKSIMAIQPVDDQDFGLISIYGRKTKGKKKDWLPSCYPPKEVEITVEIREAERITKPKYGPCECPTCTIQRKRIKEFRESNEN